MEVQPVREAILYRRLFTAGWFGVREKHCSRLEIYDRLRASEQVVNHADVADTIETVMSVGRSRPLQRAIYPSSFFALSGVSVRWLLQSNFLDS